EGREGEEQDSIQGYSRVARDTRGKQLTVMVEEPEGQTAGIEDHRHRYAPASAQSPGVGVEGHRVAQVEHEEEGQVAQGGTEVLHSEGAHRQGPNSVINLEDGLGDPKHDVADDHSC